MADLFDSEKRAGNFLLLAGILFFFILWFIDGYDQKQNNPTKIVQKVNEKFRTMEKESLRVLKSVTEKTDTLDSGSFILAKHAGGEIPDGFAVFVCRRDSLLFWSDNTIPLAADFFRKTKSDLGVVKLKNGWYLAAGCRCGTFCFWSLSLIRHEYPLQNDYLRNDFVASFQIPGFTGITLIRNQFPVFSAGGKPLFYLTFDRSSFVDEKRETLFLCLSLAGFLFILYFLYRLYTKISWFSNHRRLFVIGFCLDVFLLRLIQFLLHFPGALYSTPLFGPELYASSPILPSLGDFVINSILLLVAAYVFYRHWPEAEKKKKIPGIILSYLLSGIYFSAAFYLAIFLINNLVINSSFPINFRNVSDFVPASIYGVLIVCFILLSLLLVVIGILRTWRRVRITVPMVLLFFFLLSVFATMVLNEANGHKEKEKRKILAVKLAARRNPLTEILYDQLEHKLLSDELLLGAGKSEKFDNGGLTAYLKQNYFTDYWKKFNIQVTVCSKGKRLRVQPQGYEVNCRDYFHNLISNIGEGTPSSNLYFLDYGFGNENYLSVIPLTESSRRDSVLVMLYLEFNSKTLFKDLGYPELLIDKQRVEIPDLADYSYGLYQNRRLVHSVGAFPYRIEMPPRRTSLPQGAFIFSEGMDHYFYQIDRSSMLVLSRQEENLLDRITPCSYLFIFLGLLSLLFYVILHSTYLLKLFPVTLKDRLQVLMIGILVFSFILVGIVSGYNIVRLNSVKNEVNLRERALSVLNELQQKWGDLTSVKNDGSEDMNDLLLKLSNIFFTDINVYNLQGMIAGSSRSQIFEEGLVSDRINREAYYDLVSEKRSLVIKEESIGGLVYSSVYLPFYNDHGALLGFLNLPSFSRQDELKKEVSSFLVTVVNIYVLLVLAGIVIIFFLSRYFTSPLSILAGNLARIQVGRNNEKILWTRKDEIGQLVEEYNRMIDELERSAEKLAYSEREGAWREMARQVAHEIKNPLTPMKLSIQYMQRSWQGKGPEDDVRFDRFFKTLIEQIDTLASIASAFSDFAKMPDPEKETLDLAEVLCAAVTLYQDLGIVRFTLDIATRPAMIRADRKQLLRALTNLLNNAVQAVGDQPGGAVFIALSREADRYRITIRDNGSGIPTDQAARIFQPNFTTKSGGMGLGLAIVKGILQSIDGIITFENPAARGAQFTIIIPCIKEAKIN